ncbi:MarR family winged helix-turn-helix transcriptional regulator [Clostridium cellulovorans]|uniref:Transcriptional regulator, MarR family n=1 Tax=Clostridium cellulovorans (strain ATCC 35296 / DSM 3052 / OCM 3 / 743B) TaxID=573061 RepID=D9SR16_CLOC7|nr:MarR family transcriptional regulator [Clostridium cellulovorans]ADL50304.1 transcriptional regulator, MarR family [Clostridium cellulovorans 743B]
MNNQGSGYLRELIRILARHLGVLEKEDSNCSGVTTSQCHAIVEVGRAGEISLNELADILTLDKSTMSRTINNLVDKKLVIREIDPTDRRYVMIKLTDEGMKIFNDIESSMNQYYGIVFNNLPENKREQVLESLNLLIDAVDKK